MVRALIQLGMVLLLAGCAAAGPVARASAQDEIQSILRNALRPCWNVEDGDAWPAVRIRAHLNRTGEVVDAHLVEDDRYGSDPDYRAAADAALRAVRNPACQPFPLPPDQFPAWERIEFNFDPRDMP